MAKKLNAKKKGAGDAPEKIIGRDACRNLIKFMAGKQGKIDEIAGQMGGEIAKAVETRNLHKGAFGLVRRLDKMDGTKLRTFLLHFDRYREHLDLDKRAAEQVDFVADDEEQEAAAGKNSGKKKRDRKKKLGHGFAAGSDEALDAAVKAAEARGEDTAGLRERLAEEAKRATLQ